MGMRKEIRDNGILRDGPDEPTLDLTVANLTVEGTSALGASGALAVTDYLEFTNFTLEDGTQLIAFSAGASATPGYSQEANKERVIRWNNNGTLTKIIGTLNLPADIDDSQDITITFSAKLSGTTDTPVIEHECYIGAGDTDCAGADPEVTGGVTLADYTATILAADVPAGGGLLTIVLSPLAGELGTDDFLLYSVTAVVKRLLAA